MSKMPFFKIVKLEDARRVDMYRHYLARLAESTKNAASAGTRWPKKTPAVKMH